MELPPIEKLSPLVTRILGQNPGKFTLQGTNTYFVGRTAPYIVIDTGEGRPEYLPHLRTFLEPDGEPYPVTDIILTHKHPDHHEGLIDILNQSWLLPYERKPTGGHARIHMYPLPSGETDLSLNTTISRLKRVKYARYDDDTPVHPLADGAKLRTKDGSAELEVIHTPGHTADSISIILYSLHDDSPPVPEALFTADTVLGAGTAVFEDLSSYMTSLRRLVSLPIWSSSSPVSIYPGHGPSVPPEKAKAHIETYISHRETRENQVLGVLKGKMTIGQIVESIYVDVSRSLWPAAAHGVGLHLRKLEVEGKARKVGGSASGVVSVSPMDGARMEQAGAALMDQEWEPVEGTKL